MFQASRFLKWKCAPPKRFRQIFLEEIIASANFLLLVSKYQKRKLTAYPQVKF